MWYDPLTLNYHPDDFLSLIEAVEAQGGAHLSELCKPDLFRLNLPIDDENPKGPKANRKLTTTGCRRRAKFLVPLLTNDYVDDIDLLDGAFHGEYDEDGSLERRPAEEEDFDFDKDHPKQKLMGDGTPMLAKVCAVDDAMGLWPRFQNAMQTGESFQE